MLTPQPDNYLLNSLLLTIDHEILLRGNAYTPTSGLFYPIQSNMAGQFMYAAPFKPICNDTSITGCPVMSGVYLNGNFVTIGQSGMLGINHYNGTVIFNQALPANTVISGNYAVKDVNIMIADQVEDKLLFETEYQINPMYNQVLSGIPLDAKTSPSIFLRIKNQINKPFALGGIDEKIQSLRAIVITNTEYQRSAICNILKNMAYTPYYILPNQPFDFLGTYTGIPYNFTALSRNPNYFPWIYGTRVSDIPQMGEYQRILKNMAFVDFDLRLAARHI